MSLLKKNDSVSGGNVNRLITLLSSLYDTPNNSTINLRQSRENDTFRNKIRALSSDTTKEGTEKRTALLVGEISRLDKKHISVDTRIKKIEDVDKEVLREVKRMQHPSGKSEYNRPADKNKVEARVDTTKIKTLEDRLRKLEASNDDGLSKSSKMLPWLTKMVTRLSAGAAIAWFALNRKRILDTMKKNEQMIKEDRLKKFIEQRTALGERDKKTGKWITTPGLGPSGVDDEYLESEVEPGTSRNTSANLHMQRRPDLKKKSIVHPAFSSAEEDIRDDINRARKQVAKEKTEQAKQKAKKKINRPWTDRLQQQMYRATTMEDRNGETLDQYDDPGGIPRQRKKVPKLKAPVPVPVPEPLAVSSSSSSYAKVLGSFQQKGLVGSRFTSMDRQMSAREFQNQQEKSQFLKFGALPPGFEHVTGNRGILGKPMAVAAGGAMPWGGGYSGGGGDSEYSGGTMAERSYKMSSVQGGSVGQTFTSQQAPSDFTAGRQNSVPIEAYKNFGDGSVRVDAKGNVNRQDYYKAAVKRFANSPLNGFVPEDGYRYGIKSGAPEEWANLAMRMTKVESNFNVNVTNMSDPGGSRGLLQWGNRYGINNQTWRDPNKQLDAFVGAADKWIVKGGGYINPPKGVKAKRYQGWGGFGAMFSTIRNDKANRENVVETANRIARNAPQRLNTETKTQVKSALETQKPSASGVSAQEKMLGAKQQSLIMQEEEVVRQHTDPLYHFSKLAEQNAAFYSQNKSDIKADVKEEAGSAFTSVGDPTKDLRIRKNDLSNYGSRARKAKYEYIGVHYTGGDTIQSALNRAKNENIGYQYLIDIDGTVVRVQDPDTGRSNHWGTNRAGPAGNHNSVGISFVGREGKATKAQIIAGMKLIERERIRYGIKPENVLGHGEATINHRSNLEGDSILTPYRKWKGIRNPNIFNKAAFKQFAVNRRPQIGKPGENLSPDLLKAMQTKDPSLEKFATLQQYADEPTTIPTQNVPKGLEAQYQLNTMRDAQRLIDVKRREKEDPSDHVSEKRMEIPGVTAETRKRTMPDPDMSELDAGTPTPQPTTQREQITAAADVESQVQVEEKKRDAVIKQKASDSSDSSNPAGGSGYQGGGGSRASHSEKSFPRAGDHGAGQMKCWV